MSRPDRSVWRRGRRRTNRVSRFYREAIVEALTASPEPPDTCEGCSYCAEPWYLWPESGGDGWAFTP